MKTVNKEKVNKLMEKGAILVDMRSPVAFRDGHIPNAVNLPLRNFNNMLMSTSDKKKPIIMYGETVEDKELSQGYNYAEQMGFTQIFVTDYNSLK